MSTEYMNIHDSKLARQRITKKQFVSLLIETYGQVIWENAPACCGAPATTWFWYWDKEACNYKPAGVWENGQGATPYGQSADQDNR